MKLDLIHFFDKDGLVDLNEMDYESAVLLKGHGTFRFKVNPDRTLTPEAVFTLYKKMVLGFWNISITPGLDRISSQNTLIVLGEINIVAKSKSRLNTNHLARVDISYQEITIL
jgi:hypothetical protein